MSSQGGAEQKARNSNRSKRNAQRDKRSRDPHSQFDQSQGQRQPNQINADAEQAAGGEMAARIVYVDDSSEGRANEEKREVDAISLERTGNGIESPARKSQECRKSQSDKQRSPPDLPHALAVFWD